MFGPENINYYGDRHGRKKANSKLWNGMPSAVLNVAVVLMSRRLVKNPLPSPMIQSYNLNIVLYANIPRTSPDWGGSIRKKGHVSES